MDAFRFLNDFNYKSTFGAWLKRIVINKSINVLRKRKVDLVDIDTTPVFETPNDEVLDEENIQLRVAEVKKAVALLPNGYRTVLTLYLFEGYDHEEISEIMRISESTVRTQYHRAKHKLLHIIKGGES
jgi:RNA polymerase sigma-70 factor (ECF subfamily)